MFSITKKLGLIIKRIRKKENISQEELGSITSLHRTYISDVELGKRNITINNLYKISIALHTKLYILIKQAELMK